MFEGGYNGYSMSNRAREAYENGEKPKSKWAKADILQAVKEISPEKAEMLKNVKLPALRLFALERSSWHHTSEYFNETDFYSINENFIDELTPEKIKELENFEFDEKEARVFRGNFYYIEWTGTRKHPKANPQALKNVIIEEKGSFYKVFDDKGNVIVRKKKGSNGTEVVDYEFEERRAKAIEEEDKRRIEWLKKLEILRLENSTPKARAFLENNKGNVEYSSSGNVYIKGRKPSKSDYWDSKNFFNEGEIRLAPNNFHNQGDEGYHIETWNGENWIPEE